MKNYEVAAAVGIEDPNYFSVCFRRKYKTTPKGVQNGGGTWENRCRIRNWLRRFGVQISFLSGPGAGDNTDSEQDHLFLYSQSADE